MSPTRRAPAAWIAGNTPSSSSSRTPRGPTRSPHALSRGNARRSTSATRAPARARHSAAVLPAMAGRDYPGYGIAVSRLDLDAALFQAAVAAGAHPVRDLVLGLTGGPRAPTGVRLAAGGDLPA